MLANSWTSAPYILFCRYEYDNDTCNMAIVRRAIPCAGKKSYLAAAHHICSSPPCLGLVAGRDRSQARSNTGYFTTQSNSESTSECTVRKKSPLMTGRRSSPSPQRKELVCDRSSWRKRRCCKQWKRAEEVVSCAE